MTATADRQTRLNRMKRNALLLFLAALVLFVISHLCRDNHPIWGYLNAFSEAAMVGGLADWFAVVALFKHPLGLPIPHTAIIPHGKQRIADNLATFVRDHFLSPDKLGELLKKFNVATHLTNWLRQPTNAMRLSTELRRWLSGLLKTLDDERITGALFELLNAQALRWNAAASLGEVLALLTKDQRHQAVLDSGLQKIAQALERPSVRERIGSEINDFLREAYPKLHGTADALLVGSSMAEVTQALGNNLTDSLIARLQAVLGDATHPWRQEYADWLAGYMQRLKADATLQNSFNEVKNRLLQDSATRQFVTVVWGDIKARLTSDLLAADSTLGDYAARALQAIGEKLADDADLRDSVNQHLYAAAAHATDFLRSGVTDHIANTIKAWDDKQLVRELELSVGHDLQFIRINGTLVGGLAGLLIYTLAQWI